MFSRSTCLLVLLLLFSSAAFSQTGFLFVKKGANKKRSYTEGDRIHLLLHNGEHRRGIITLLMNDTIYVNGKAVPRMDVSAVVLNEAKKKKFPADAKTLLAITGGVALTSVGLSLNKMNKPKDAIIAAATIGYAPLLLKHFGGRFLYFLQRKKFRIGKKYRLQVLDLHLPRRRAF
jgi:hypothetical protein